MSRPLRIHYPNAWYHVMNRGAGRRKIFKNKSHRLLFLELLKEANEMFNVKIFAYCLMDNHYHLLLNTPDANLSRVMRHINGVYTQKYNYYLNTDGSLFRGRYTAKIIEEDCYQLLVSRYIHLNPVEAGIISNPAEYLWSSYAAYLGLVKAPDWLSTDVILRNLKETKSLAHINDYQDYVENSSIEEINNYISIKNISPVFGSEICKRKIWEQIADMTPVACSPDVNRIKTTPKIQWIAECVCSFYKINDDALLSTKRGTLNWPYLVCMYICRKKYGYTLREISAYFGIRRSESVSIKFYRCYLRLKKNPVLFNDIDAIYQKIEDKISLKEHF